MPNKLHLNLSGKAVCGRQLSNHRTARHQAADTIVLAPSYGAFASALTSGDYANEAGVMVRAGACRHCARVAKLIPAVTRRQPKINDDPALWDEDLDEDGEDE